MLSIVIPVFNEAEVLPMFIARLLEASLEWTEPFEAIFVDDGSTDNSITTISNLTQGRENITIVKLSRNFGHQAAISAGIQQAKGDALVIMDADLQDPPEAISQLIHKWREGFDVVYAIRKNRKESWPKKLAYKSFYRTLRWVSDLDIPLD
ncbi:MAG: glycosyltransferase family 2 protein, partial [Bacteroidetes bacterium]|nr:glycosyltransferase family 2 protein [Bacteroidota bacterium]